MLAAIFGPDILLVVIVVPVVLFGGAAIPRLARNLGSARSEFERGVAHGSAAETAPDADPSTR